MEIGFLGPPVNMSCVPTCVAEEVDGRRYLSTRATEAGELASLTEGDRVM